MEKIIYDKLSQMDRIEYELKIIQVDISFYIYMLLTSILAVTAYISKDKFFIFLGLAVFCVGIFFGYKYKKDINKEFAERTLSKTNEHP